MSNRRENVLHVGSGVNHLAPRKVSQWTGEREGEVNQVIHEWKKERAGFAGKQPLRHSLW